MIWTLALLRSVCDVPRRHAPPLEALRVDLVLDVNHQISKTIVNSKYNTFVFEKLAIKKRKKLGRRFNKKLGGWSYGQLQQFVEYKARDVEKQTIYINPAYTSQACSVCGTIDRSFRRGNLFSCGKCELNLDADLNPQAP